MPRVITTLLLLLSLPAISARSLGADLPERKPKKVLVLPTVLMEPSCESIFSGEPRTSPLAARLHRQLETSLGTLLDIQVLPFVQARSTIVKRRFYQERVVVGRERYLLAKEYYRDLRQTEAVENLERSIDTLIGIYYDLVEPEALAEILLLAGVTLVEVGHFPEAHLAFKKALSLNPMLHLTRGFFPEPVERAITIACTDLQEGSSGLQPQELGRYQALAKELGVDSLFFSRIITREDRLFFDLTVLEKKGGNIAFQEEVPLSGDPAADGEAVDRLASRWTACAPFEKPQRTVEQLHKYLFSASYQQMAYLSYPTRTMLHNMGFSFEVGAYVLDSFGLVGKVQVISSLPDRFGDVLTPLTSTRLILGPSFSLTGQWWRLSMVPAAELHIQGPFKTSTDPDCKFFAAGSAGYTDMCDTSRVKNYPTAVVGGVNVALGAQFFFINRLFLSATMSISSYFLPLDRSKELNFPVALEVGGGVAF